MELLIQWSSLPEGAATWEKEVAIKSQFPIAKLSCGQDKTQGGGIVVSERSTPKPNELAN